MNTLINNLELYKRISDTLPTNMPISKIIQLQQNINLPQLIESAKIIKNIDPNIYKLHKIFATKSFTANIQLLNSMANLPNNYTLIEQEKDSDNEKHYYVHDTKSNKKIEVTQIPSTLAVTQFFDNISQEETLEFYHHLSEYPMIGTAHPVGKEILNSLKSYENYVDLDLTLFRARKREASMDRPFVIKELFNPSYGIANQGRYNFHGISNLYLCDSLEGALSEVRAQPPETIDIPEFRLSKRVNLLDVTEKDCALFNYCGFENKSNLNIKPEYLIPNFLSQCCKLSGIEGIKYLSDKHEDAENYVFFIFNEYDFKHITTHIKTI
ncbi:RES family NAD+ phosphorylase [Vallitalea guaymasensis]|uniref:RES family NAD+ phosphorylase n=1 Tax=Vallitalea guaymasensis TaxID=1185412 RepID=UPI000DE299F0|nr:RES family NAD+ phosphorylase [Vallitalea guaymasensis]